jgi:carboxypeptidase Taq
MEEKLREFKNRIYEITDLENILALLGWDQQTYMPHGGAEDRGDQVATLSGLIHLKITSQEMGRLLDDLEPYRQQLDPESNDACLLERVRYEYDQRTKVSAEWVEEFARITTLAESSWEEAKAKSEFPAFQPYLEKIVALQQEYASFFAPYEHIYDPLLDLFDRGMRTAEVKAVFDAVRPRQVALIQAIQQQPQVEDAFLKIPYDEKSLWDFGAEVITHFGYDWNHGRQDKSVHPFSTNFGIGDVRITTKFDPTRPMSSLFSTMHESGHAMYEQGVSRELRRTLLAAGASMSIHESQSRMFENLVGRSYPFWVYFYPRLQEKFPSQLKNVSLEVFYKGLNRVEPSLIRVDADEATYNLHIMLRMELEIALLEGSLRVADLPEVWNAKMQEYLGVTPPNNALGVLQDVHWSGGMMGYFPTYALGNMVSAQLWQRIVQDIPDLAIQIEHGKFENLLGWLRKNVHQHGSKFKPQVLLQKATGSALTPDPYLQYLETKFTAIYGL